MPIPIDCNLPAHQFESLGQQSDRSPRFLIPHALPVLKQPIPHIRKEDRWNFLSSSCTFWKHSDCRSVALMRARRNTCVADDPGFIKLHLSFIIFFLDRGFHLAYQVRMIPSSLNFSQPEYPTRVGGYNICIVDQAYQNSSGKFKASSPWNVFRLPMF